MLCRRFRLVWALPIALVPLSGCVLPDQVSKIQKDLADVQQQLRAVERRQGETLDRLGAVEATVRDEERQLTREDFADLSLLAKENGRQLAVVQEQLEDANRRMDRLSMELDETRELGRRAAELQALGMGASPSAEPDDADSGRSASSGATGAPNRGAAGAVPDAEELYNSAYADFSKGNYSLAISGFEEYADRFRTSDLADNALYWVGECYYSQGSFDEAVRAFDRMLATHPNSDRAASANLKKGLAYLEQNQIGKAIVQLRFVWDTYPSSDEARIARDKLLSLGASLD